MHEITERFLIEEIRKARKGDIVRIEWKDMYHKTGIDNGIHSGEYEFIDAEWAMIGKPYDIKIHDVKADKSHVLDFSMITRFEVIRRKLFPEPIHLLEKIEEGRLVFDEKAFYMHTGNTRHFDIVINGDIYECLFKKTNDAFSYCAEITCGLWRGDKVYKARLWNDHLHMEDISSNDVQDFTPEQFKVQKFDGEPIPFKDLFEREDVYIWNIELEVGEAYSLKLPDYENLVDGIFIGYNEQLDTIRFVVFDTDKSDTSIIDITKAAIADGSCEVRQLSLSYERKDRHE